RLNSRGPFRAARPGSILAPIGAFRGGRHPTCNRVCSMAARPSLLPAQDLALAVLAATRGRIKYARRGCGKCLAGPPTPSEKRAFLAIEIDGDTRGHIDLDGLFGRGHLTGKIGRD